MKQTSNLQLKLADKPENYSLELINENLIILDEAFARLKANDDEKINKTAYTASGDVLVGTGLGFFVKKTLLELKGLLTLSKSDVNLGEVDNTSDKNKPVSDSQQTALNLKIDKSAYTASGDILVGTGAGQYVRKTIAEIRDLIIPTGLTCYVHGTSPLPGFIKKNGALLSRTTYANLWAYAQASGNVVDDTTWNAGAYGSFSTGDGSTTFRIPDDRGYFDRAWDDGRGIDSGRTLGSSQLDDIKSHNHTASESSAGGHAHSGTTSTTGAHAHTVTKSSVPYTGGGGSYSPATDNNTSGTPMSTSSAGDHAHTFSTDSQGAHTHIITVNANGIAENRVKNIAKLAIIKY